MSYTYINGMRVPDIVANEEYPLYDQADYEAMNYNLAPLDPTRPPFFEGNAGRARARQENSLGELTRKFIELIRMSPD